MAGVIDNSSAIFGHESSTGSVITMGSWVSQSWSWSWLFYFFLLLELRRIYSLRSLKPTNMTIIGKPTIFGKLLKETNYVFFPQEVVKSTYAQTKGKLWAVLARNKYHVFVSNQDQIEEFNNAPSHDLSLHAAANELFPPLELHGGNPIGCTPNNLGLFRSTIGSSLRGSLWALQPLFNRKMIEALQTELDAGKHQNGWVKMGLNSTTYHMVIKLNSIMVVGESLTSQPRFVTCLFRYLKWTTIAEEVMKLLPTFMNIKSTMGNMMMKYGGNIEELSALVKEEVNSRWELLGKESKDENMDAIKWTIERAKDPTVEGVARQAMALFFSASHQLPMLTSFSLYTLCKHPEYLEPLRKEAEEYTGRYQDNYKNDLPLLDSFLKEVARCNPIVTVTLPHKVMTPFTFSDGASVPSGNFICIPSENIMNDASIYDDPSKFDGFRFVDRSNDESTSKLRFSHPSWKFPYWGTVKQACPGRFYADMIAKMIISHIITHYDFKLADENATPKYKWGNITITHPKLAILMRPRGQDSKQ